MGKPMVFYVKEVPPGSSGQGFEGMATFEGVNMPINFARDLSQVRCNEAFIAHLEGERQLRNVQVPVLQAAQRALSWVESASYAFDRIARVVEERFKKPEKKR